MLALPRTFVKTCIYNIGNKENLENCERRIPGNCRALYEITKQFFGTITKEAAPKRNHLSFCTEPSTSWDTIYGVYLISVV